MIRQGGWSLGGAGHVGRKPCARIAADVAVLPCGDDNSLHMSPSQNMEFLGFFYQPSAPAQISICAGLARELPEVCRSLLFFGPQGSTSEKKLMHFSCMLLSGLGSITFRST